AAWLFLGGAGCVRVVAVGAQRRLLATVTHQRGVHAVFVLLHGFLMTVTAGFHLRERKSTFAGDALQFLAMTRQVDVRVAAFAAAGEVHRLGKAFGRNDQRELFTARQCLLQTRLGVAVEAHLVFFRQRRVLGS